MSARGGERRQRRTRRRRQQILEAAAQVFARNGYHAATTREIAQEADLAEGTLYNYFSSKRDMLQAIIEEAPQPVRDLSPVHCNPQDLRAIAYRILEESLLALRSPQIVNVQVLIGQAWLDQEVVEAVMGRLNQAHQNMVGFLERCVASEALRPIDPDLCARMLMGMYAGLALPVIRGVQAPPSPERCRELAEMIVDLLLDGARPRPVEAEP